MLLRRFAGSLLTLLTLHLNLLGADFACAKHGSASGSQGHGTGQHQTMSAATPSVDTPDAVMHDAMMHDAMMHDATTQDASTPTASGHGGMDMSAPVADAGTPSVTNDSPPCDVPTQPNCCKALASCSVVFSAANELDVGSVPSLHAVIAPFATTAAPFERAAPEPPPPKA